MAKNLHKEMATLLHGICNLINSVARHVIIGVLAINLLLVHSTIPGGVLSAMLLQVRGQRYMVHNMECCGLAASADTPENH